MKLSLFGFVAVIALSAVSYADSYSCVLENKPLKKSPLAVIEQTKKETTVRIQKNVDDRTALLPETVVVDGSEDVEILLESKEKSINVHFYLDESDSLGLLYGGSIKSPVMTGAIRCNRM